MLSVFGDRPVGVYARQVHGNQVAVLEANRTQAGTICLEGDALITNRPDSTLVIQTADCQSVILIDPLQRAVANVHSGWRGSIANIIGRTVAAMADKYGTRPRDLICGIGPSLGPCCAEFVNFRKELPRPFWNYRRSGDLFDFWRISVDQLATAGVRPDNIEVSGICTKCNQHHFFSYRGDQNTGRFAAVVGISSAEGKQV